MTWDEFYRKFRGDFGFFLTDAWAVRKMKPSEIGMEFDMHTMKAKELMQRIFEALTHEKVKELSNGQDARTERIRLPISGARHFDGDRDP